jgi:hypothetical protein
VALKSQKGLLINVVRLRLPTPQLVSLRVQKMGYKPRDV